MRVRRGQCRGMPQALHPFWPALAALLAAGAVRLGARLWPRVGPFAVPAGLLAGAVVLCLPFNLRAVWAPRIVPDFLLGVALAGGCGAALAGRVRRRWVPGFAVCFVSAWWVAHAPPALPEFWRVGLVVTLAALVSSRAGPFALALGGVAGGGACWAAGAAPVWAAAFLLAAAACAAGEPGGAAPRAAAGASFLAAVSALAVLAGGRVLAGRLGPADAAVLLPLVVALAAGPVLRRLPRLRPGRPAPSRTRPAVAVRRRRA